MKKKKMDLVFLEEFMKEYGLNIQVTMMHHDSDWPNIVLFPGSFELQTVHIMTIQIHIMNLDRQ